ncbi:MAG: hypothetical protein A4E56_03106 [Pelotomaculum sp. PtaU1.Bin065]|nr:MAG: hypothetical protein A4E56_03106 [Pelotomaculum sp. PtaU1.Bin065]
MNFEELKEMEYILDEKSTVIGWDSNGGRLPK